MADMFTVESEIAQDITAQLKLESASEEQRRLVKRDSTNTEAYEAYLRGRYF